MFDVGDIRVEFEHISDFDKYAKEFGDALSRRFSHITECTILGSGITIATGKSYCMHEDNFDRYFGRKRSLTRALENSGFDKDTRTEIWNTYWSIVKCR
jgi:hypothetical protein